MLFARAVPVREHQVPAVAHCRHTRCSKPTAIWLFTTRRFELKFITDKSQVALFLLISYSAICKLLFSTSQSPPTQTFLERYRLQYTMNTVLDQPNLNVSTRFLQHFVPHVIGPGDKNFISSTNKKNGYHSTGLTTKLKPKCITNLVAKV